MSDAMALPVEDSRGDAPLLSWVASVDHKQVGLMYLAVSLFFLFVGGIEALLMRVQLAVPQNNFLSPNAYNQVFTMHGTTMIFLVVMPTLIGFANYFVPLMIGARDVAFPRLNAFGVWMLLFGGLVLYYSFLAGGAPDAGWFAYTPLSEKPYSTTWGMDYWILGLLLTGVGTVTSAINFIVTIFTLRAPGMTMRRLPLFVWMMLVTSFLIIFALPALNAALVMLFVDRYFQGHFFQGSGNPVLWQHYFWAFGHPEVYIMALPGFGMISEVIPVFARKPIFGYQFVAMSSVAIAFLSYGVWVHHMFAVGLGTVPLIAFGATSMLIAVPTGVKIFNWTATLYGGRLRFKTALLFAIAFLVQFTVGGLSGVSFAMVPLDWQTTDTYFVVAHFHYVLFGGTLFAIMAAVYYWFPKMSGRMLDERIGRWNFWLLVLGFNGTFMIQHWLGLIGMPRRVFTYPDLPGWGWMNMVSTVSAFVMGFSFVVLVYNVWISLQRGEIAGDNPWQAWTLEWATPSPPPHDNFARVPLVRSRRPLWDLAHPDLADWRHEEGRGGNDDQVERPDNPVALFTALFIAQELTFFVFLILAYVLLHNKVAPGQPTAADSLDRAKAGVFTLFLLASSGTLWLSERALRAERWRAFTGWLVVSIVLGGVFLTGQGMEYAHLFSGNVTISRNLFGTAFFTLTGVHGLHVLIGLVSLLALAVLALLGGRRRPSARAVEAVGLYWHFVDVVWIFIFSLVYLGVNL